MKEGKRVWKCDLCGNEGTWSDDWTYYGSLKELEDHCREGIIVACSRRCQEIVTDIALEHKYKTTAELKGAITRLKNEERALHRA